MSRRNPPEGCPSAGGDQARVLALKLIETCKHSGADPRVVISALSVVLGMVIGNVAEDPEVADIAIDTVHRAIAANNEDDPAERLQ
jgi:thymidine phosphorylase